MTHRPLKAGRLIGTRSSCRSLHSLPVSFRFRMPATYARRLRYCAYPARLASRWLLLRPEC